MSSRATAGGFFKSELGLRILSAIVLLIFTIGLSWLGGWLFTLFAVLLSVMMFYEWQSIVRVTPFDGTEAALTVGFAGLLLASLFGYLTYALPLFLLLGLVLELTNHGQEKRDVRWIGLGALYCAIPAIAFPIIREGSGFALLMFVFLVVWMTDIAAYFAGRQFGGPKLFAAVSPKKTWSGAAGGLLGAIIIGAIFVGAVDGVSIVATILMAAALSVASQIGDLFESWVKRMFNVKDSSNLIPGHGGFLDRVDGLVAAALPAALLVALSAG